MVPSNTKRIDEKLIFHVHPSSDHEQGSAVQSGTVAAAEWSS